MLNLIESKVTVLYPDDTCHVVVRCARNIDRGGGTYGVPVSPLEPGCPATPVSPFEPEINKSQGTKLMK